MPKKFASIIIDRNFICIPESFNTNISHQLFDYIITCKFTALEHKFKRGFLTQKLVLKFLVYKNKSDTGMVWRIQLKVINFLHTEHEFFTLKNH